MIFLVDSIQNVKRFVMTNGLGEIFDKVFTILKNLFYLYTIPWSQVRLDCKDNIGQNHFYCFVPGF